MISALSIDHLLTRESSAPDELLFHYTSRESLRTILESGNLRLNTLDRINDPRERSEWIADKIVIPPGDITAHSLAGQDEVLGQIDTVLRLGARVARLTSDRARSSELAASTYFHRGWGRARMWEQYGQQRQGAVLVFDKMALIESIDEERKVADGDSSPSARCRTSTARSRSRWRVGTRPRPPPGCAAESGRTRTRRPWRAR